MRLGDWPPRRGRLSCRIGRSIFSNWTANRTRSLLHTRSFSSCFVDQRIHTCRTSVHNRPQIHQTPRHECLL